MTEPPQRRPGFGMPVPGRPPPPAAGQGGQPGNRGADPAARRRAGGADQPGGADQDSPAGLLPADATVNLAAERKAAGIDEILGALDRELVGLAPIKQRIREIAALLLVDRVRERFGLAATRPSLHMCFTGAPGTGKTTVALRMAELLHRVGYLERGHLVAVTRDDLVGQYVGHTAPKTKEVLKRAMGGVLFIDEAYYLYRADNERDYGQESIEILLQVMENQRDKIVVILAGYKDRMDQFFASNPGMSSRIAHHLDFPEYSLAELAEIAQLMLGEVRYRLSEEAEETLREYLARRMRQPRFANARSVRNALERARLRHASRLLAEPDRAWNRDDLMRLEPADLLASRVFSQPGGPAAADDYPRRLGGGSGAISRRK
jgi:probable Rubsico expression protein CbbX